MATQKVYKLRPHLGDDGKWYVRIKAGNGQVVGSLHQPFSSKRAAQLAAQRLEAARLVVVLDKA